MNSLTQFQKSALWLGIVIMIGMGIYPPWQERGTGNPLDYAPIYAPASVITKTLSVRIDFARLLLQWSLVGFAIAGALITAHGSGDDKKQVGRGKLDANPRAVKTDKAKTDSSKQEITLSFPPGVCLGELLIESCDDPDYWESFAQASGSIEIPAGRRLQLEIAKDAPVDLTSLRQVDARAIQSLDFSHSAVKNIDLANISNLTQLYELDLTDTSITDEGIEHLSRITTLRKLWLDRTKVTDRSLQMLSGLPELKKLSLVSTEVTEAAVSQVKTGFPANCDILLPSGKSA